jgi:hypothetical protein
LWRENYIRTFLERDIPNLGIKIPAETLRRFWIMLSHYHGRLLQYAELGRSFSISDKTVKNYLDILCGTYMVRLLPPWHENLGKRLVKSSKLYLKDSGIFHSLQTIDSRHILLSHNKLGASWEGFVLEQALRILQIDQPFFWRTHNGAELDLLWHAHGKRFGIEFKYSDAPGMTKSMHSVIGDLGLEHLWIIYPGKDAYNLNKTISVAPLQNLGMIKNAIR